MSLWTKASGWARTFVQTLVAALLVASANPVTRSGAGQEKGPYRKAQVAVKRVGDAQEVEHRADHVK
jgi:hypothetical protein